MLLVVNNETMGYPRDLAPILTSFLNKPFEKVGNLPLYRSVDELVIGRWSKKYEISHDYWYGLKAHDFKLMKEHPVTHFAYVCEDEGVLLLSKKDVMKQVNENNLTMTEKADGSLLHYHIRLDNKDGQLCWILSKGMRKNVEEYYCRT